MAETNPTKDLLRDNKFILGCLFALNDKTKAKVAVINFYQNNINVLRNEGPESYCSLFDDVHEMVRTCPEYQEALKNTEDESFNQLLEYIGECSDALDESEDEDDDS